MLSIFFSTQILGMVERRGQCHAPTPRAVRAALVARDHAHGIGERDHGVVEEQVLGLAQLPQQRLDREEALKSITIWPAYAAFMENDVGSISVGKLADFVVLDRDIMTVPADEILGARVMQTVVGGRSVYLAR